MPAVATSVVRKQIASGETEPLYALVGGDDTEKSAVAAEFAEMVDEGLRAFNVERMYGGEMKVNDLVDSASTLPMMVPRRVVIVFEAEKLFIPKRESKAADEELQRLEEFLDAPAASHDDRLPLWCARHAPPCGQAADEQGAGGQLRCHREARPTRSAGSRFGRRAKGSTSIPRRRARSWREQGSTSCECGRDSSALSLYAMGQPTITPDDVRQAVAAGPEAHADFGIANAIQRNDVREALREVGRSLDAGMVPFFILGQLRIAAHRLPARRVKPAVEAVFRTDIALKSSGGDPRILIERLVVELCESRRA